MDRFEKSIRDWYANLTEAELKCSYRGAWTACDADGARRALDELDRRGVDTSIYSWPQR